MADEDPIDAVERAMVGLRRSIAKRTLGRRVQAALAVDPQHLAVLDAVAFGAEGGEVVTVGGVAEKLAVDPSRASRMVAGAVDAGLVRRLAAQHDGRLVFPDDATYQAYKKGGGTLSRSDWRRQNVDLLVKRLSDSVQQTRPEVRFGISPFGIYRPGKPAGIRGLDQVAMLHADPLKWFTQGWVDYLAPQLYWPTSAKAQAYDKLLAWWDDQVTPERPLIVGLDLTKVGRDPKWPLAELRRQVDLARGEDQTAGQIWFRAQPVLKNQAGVGDLLDELYAQPALPPPLARSTAPMAPPKVAVTGRELRLAHPGPRKDLRAFVLYRQAAGGTWEVREILGPGTEKISLAPGVWAVSAVHRTGVESKGVEVRIGDPTDGVAEP